MLVRSIYPEFEKNDRSEFSESALKTYCWEGGTKKLPLRCAVGPAPPFIHFNRCGTILLLEVQSNMFTEVMVCRASLPTFSQLY